MIGTSLAHYEILAQLGKGGMGEVFQARDTRLARHIALKVLPEELASDRERLDRFQREARVVAALSHPNIVTIHSVEEANGYHFLTMELVTGSTLEDVIRDGGVEIDTFMNLALQMADAVAAAHESGVTHRDLKPGNVMVDERGHVKVLDFGLAKVQLEEPEPGSASALPTEALTQEGLVLGTLPYMSPEQLQGRDVSARSDVFSLGSVLYELLTGRRPFVGESTADLISTLLRDPPPPIEHRDAAVGSHLDRILERCLDKDPAARYPNAGELLEDLRRLAEQLNSSAGPSTLAPRRPLPARPALVGRAREREHLREAVGRARAGQGALLLLTGEAGSGKTRLAQFAQDEAMESGFLALVGHSRDREGGQPYLALIEQIEEAARFVPAEALRQALGPNAPEVAKLMPDLRQRFDDIPDPVVMPPDQERRYMLHGVSEFIERSAQTQPLLLVYEDLHWADESTLFLLRHLAHRLAGMPVLILGTYRHGEVEGGSALATVLQDLLRERLAEELLVGRLSLQEVGELIAERAGKPAPRELVERIHTQTDGNPFFVEEVYRHLSETDELFDDRGEWRSAVHRAETEVPRSVGLVIGQRLDRISADCRTMLTAAAVIGRSFRFDVLSKIVSLDEDDLLDAIDEAEAQNLIEDASTGREARYGFGQEPIRQALVADLSVPRRQRLHLRVANALEQRRDGETGAIELAHHLWEAGAAAEEERTFRALLSAASRARQSLAFEESLRYLDRAREVTPQADPEAAIRVLLSRARSERSLARVDGALATLQAALDRDPEPELRDEILYARARLLLDQFRGAEAAADLERLLEAARGRGDREAELALVLDMARAHYVLSLDKPTEHAEATRDAYQEAYDLAQELGDRRSMAKALIPTTFFTDYWSDYRKTAVANLAEAERLAQSLGDEDLELDVATASLKFLRPTDSALPARQLRQRLEQRGDPIRLKELYFLLMWDYWARGELEDCVEVCSAGIDLARQLGIEPVQYPSIQSLALLDLGRFGEAKQALEAEVADEDHRFGRCMQQLALANYQIRLRSFGDAADTALATLEEATQLKRVWIQSWTVDLLHQLLDAPGVDAAELESRLERHGEIKPFRTLPSVRAERLLVAGDAAGALDAALERAGFAEQRGLARMQLACLEVGVRALDALENWSELVEVAGRARQIAEQAGADDFVWRIAGLESKARTASGSEDEGVLALARKTLERVASTIPEAGLRDAYLADPLARLILGAGH